MSSRRSRTTSAMSGSVEDEKTEKTKASKNVLIAEEAAEVGKVRRCAARPQW